MFKRILCPIDGSETSFQALDLAGRLASDQNAQLTLCTVVNPSEIAAQVFPAQKLVLKALHDFDDRAARLLSGAVERIKPVQAYAVTIHGDATASIVQYASTHTSDLIVMGSHGRGGLRRLLLGSVAEGVLKQAPMPVIVVRTASEAPHFYGAQETQQEPLARGAAI